MTVAKRPARPRLVLAAVGLACVGIVGVLLWLLAGVAGANPPATSGDRQTTATVMRGAACQGSDAFDSVHFTLDGHSHQAKINGCGHSPGDTVGVLVPPNLTADSVLDLSDAAPGDSAGLSQRVAFLLLIVAAGVGGGSAYLLRHHLPAGRRGPVPPDAGRPGRAAPNGLPRDRSGADHDPDETGIDWFEDSGTSLPVDLGEHADKS